jgi:S-adenosylmethionine synthetase
MSSYIWTSESVSPGHPDKIADCISDAILDEYLKRDPDAKVACEVMVKNLDVYVCGEISSTANLSDGDIRDAAIFAIQQTGYDSNVSYFNSSKVNIHLNISQQAPEIHNAVVVGDELTAGDQGIMFGYATRETPTFMPIPIYLARQFVQESFTRRHELKLRPDMKSQVSIYYEDGIAKHIDNVVLSMCHDESYTLTSLREMFHYEIRLGVMRNLDENLQSLFTEKTKWHINPAGTWNIGGPISDCGLTGRKIVVDQYGADCEIGGGAFSGKDPSKVDRSAAYMARHIALRTLKENEDSNKVKVQLAYAIGEKYPVSYRIYDPTTGKEFGLGTLTRGDLTPSGIISRLGLKSPIYSQTALRGHFGVNPYEAAGGTKYFEWENV